MSSSASSPALSPPRAAWGAGLAVLGGLAAWALPPVAFAFFALAGVFAWLLPRPAGWLAVLTWTLPFHIVAMAVLFGGLGLPASVVRPLAAWKEAAVLVLLLAVCVRTATGHGSRAGVSWLDLVVGGLIVLAVLQFIAAPALSRPDPGLAVRLYGVRDSALLLLPYFIGRATPDIAGDDAPLGRLYGIGVVTSSVAVVEWFFVPPQLLVLLGVALYFNDFLGASAATVGNEFGLPANYWTYFGGMELRRAGSVMLSSQGFAVPFLLIVPAATTWLLSRRDSSRWRWLGYAVLWLGLILSVTRMTIVACAVQFVILAIAFRRRGLAVGAIGGALAAIGVAMAMLPRLATFVWQTLTWTQGSSTSHLKDYAKGLNTMIDYPLGAGLGTSDATALRFGLDPLTFDNLFLKVGVELGIAGLLSLLALLAGLLLVGVRLAREGTTSPQRHLGAVVAVATLGVFINGMTNNVLGNFVFAYLFLWLAGAAVTLSRRLPAQAAGG